MATHNELGAKGEKLAQGFLIKNGYKIIASNWRYKNLEVDIICTLENTLCFVEVKSRSASFLVDPASSVTRKKQKFIIKSAHEFLLKNEQFELFDVQFDILSIVFDTNSYKINHLKEAFYPQL